MLGRCHIAYWSLRYFTTSRNLLNKARLCWEKFWGKQKQSAALSLSLLTQQEENVLLEPAAPMFHLLIFGNVAIKNTKIHEIQKSVNSKNP